jgi:hypothetical protein
MDDMAVPAPAYRCVPHLAQDETIPVLRKPFDVDELRAIAHELREHSRSLIDRSQDLQRRSKAACNRLRILSG